MAKSYKVLAQSAPSATTATNIYTVPASTQTVISTITVCNRGGSAATFRIAVRPNGATLANEHYVCYGVSVPPTDTIALTIGITVDAADVVTVYASTADLTFSIFGSEIV
jgi:hypothetical protein